MMLIGGIDSEEPWIFSKKVDIFWGLGSLRNALPRVFFLPKMVRPAQWPVQWKNFAPKGGGGGLHLFWQAPSALPQNMGSISNLHFRDRNSLMPCGVIF